MAKTDPIRVDAYTSKVVFLRLLAELADLALGRLWLQQSVIDELVLRRWELSRGISVRAGKHRRLGGRPLEKGNRAVEDDVYCVVNSIRAHLANIGADTKTGGVVVKVILECCLLTDEEVVEASKLCVSAGADFVKTSTGFSKHGATEHHIKLMRDTVGDKVGVKAAGGVRTPEDMDKMVRAGATRIGTSNGVALMTGGTGTGY
mmetsp:Transcript_13544/g.11365  ORF Transcript_13544/g.11365 Transcript_13544/m.11365 type:complete len:204 (+) Transcript_13544:182-793(+)